MGRFAGYFHEIDDWCPPEVYPLYVERLDITDAERLMRQGFVCSHAFEARAVILGVPPADVVTARPIEEEDELLLMHVWSGSRDVPRRDWWRVKRTTRLP